MYYPAKYGSSTAKTVSVHRYVDTLTSGPSEVGKLIKITNRKFRFDTNVPHF